MRVRHRVCVVLHASGDHEDQGPTDTVSNDVHSPAMAETKTKKKKIRVAQGPCRKNSGQGRACLPIDQTIHNAKRSDESILTAAVLLGGPLFSVRLNVRCITVADRPVAQRWTA
jgi:hypothetical protein